MSVCLFVCLSVCLSVRIFGEIHAFVDSPASYANFDTLFQGVPKRVRKFWALTPERSDFPGPQKFRHFQKSCSEISARLQATPVASLGAPALRVLSSLSHYSNADCTAPYRRPHGPYRTVPTSGIARSRKFKGIFFLDHQKKIILKKTVILFPKYFPKILEILRDFRCSTIKC